MSDNSTQDNSEELNAPKEQGEHSEVKSKKDKYEKRSIKTALVGKEEVFKVLALGESTQLPVLLIGEPGVAKTQSLLDYAGARFEGNKDEAKKKSFVIELDEGTKTSEIKGRVNMKELLEDKRYYLDTPIADAEFVLINEVDKGSSGVRNTMLSVMRERALFLGNDVRKCHWRVFCGSCNEISSEKADAPFWDRFVIKYKTDRVPLAKLKTVWNNEDREFWVRVPTAEQIFQMPVNPAKIEIFAKHIYKDVTDRTISYIPKLVKAIKIIWDVSDTEAIIKACEFLASKAVSGLAGILEDPKIAAIKTKITHISSIMEVEYMGVFLGEIETSISELSGNPDYKDDLMDVHDQLKKAIAKSEICRKILGKKPRQDSSAETDQETDKE